MRTGDDGTRLVVLRGPSGSGKSSAARELRRRVGRGVALVEQDYLRRILLREHDRPGGANIELISNTARFALDRGFHVILEGIMPAARYGAMLRSLHDDHAGRSFFYYFDISWSETLRRHATRPKSAEFGATEMSEWFGQAGRLELIEERTVSESLSLDEIVRRLQREVF
ncbi:AAA family ATPase [Saccharopolyspora sp. NPDC049357]|uniref:AAA family ATPase n=1 Tax=Saccharopolyspora sp. NPDC049357 TaxID=3154507 RepID=UPI00342E78F8